MSIGRESALAFLFAFGLTACVRPASVPSGVNITSERSDYSPTARLAVALAPLRLAGDSLDIVIDSGSLSVPGEGLGDTTAIMRNFHLTALFVVSRRTGREQSELHNPWRTVAHSDSLLVLDGLRQGERRPFGTMRLRIPRPVDFNPGKTWLVFRITGLVVQRGAYTVGQPAEVNAPRFHKFRVFACAEWNLAGRVDRDRARRVRVSYLAAC